MLVEFFGLPGSGKSTMSRIVAGLLRERSYDVGEVTYHIEHRHSGTSSQLLKLGHIAPYAAAYPWRALSDAARIAGTGQASTRDLAKSIFNWTFVSSIASRQRAAFDVCLLDQGVAQALWSIGFAARRDCWLDLLDAAAPASRPDLVIGVSADLATVGCRLAARQIRASRMDAHGENGAALRRAAQQVGAILARLRAAGVAVIEIDNSDGAQLARGSRVAAEAIEAMLQDRSAIQCTHGQTRSRRRPIPLPSRGRSEECRS